MKNKIKIPGLFNADKLIIFGLLVMFTLIAAFTQHPIIALFELTITLVALMISLFKHHLRRSEINNILQGVTFYADSSTNATVIDFPLPALILRTNGEVMWYNKAFEKSRAFSKKN